MFLGYESAFISTRRPGTCQASKTERRMHGRISTCFEHSWPSFVILLLFSLLQGRAVTRLYIKDLQAQQTMLIFRALFTAAIPPHH